MCAFLWNDAMLRQTYFIFLRKVKRNTPAQNLNRVLYEINRSPT